MALVERRLLLLQPAGVGQHQAAQLRGAACGMDATAEAVAHQRGKVPGVVEVRVRDHHRVDPGRIDGERIPVPLAQQLVALEEAAVDEDSRASGVDQVAGSGDRVGGAEEGEGGGHDPIVRAPATRPRDFGHAGPSALLGRHAPRRLEEIEEGA